MEQLRGRIIHGRKIGGDNSFMGGEFLLVWNTRGKKNGICLEGNEFQGYGVSVWEIILSMWPVLECCLNFV
jgi:hypothetical protein